MPRKRNMIPPYDQAIAEELSHLQWVINRCRERLVVLASDADHDTAARMHPIAGHLDGARNELRDAFAWILARSTAPTAPKSQVAARARGPIARMATAQAQVGQQSGKGVGADGTPPKGAA